MKKIELFPEGIEKLENSDLLLIKGGSKPIKPTLNAECIVINIIC